jgi:hypothetical protein
MREKKTDSFQTKTKATMKHVELIHPSFLHILQCHVCVLFCPILFLFTLFSHPVERQSECWLHTVCTERESNTGLAWGYPKVPGGLPQSFNGSDSLIVTRLILAPFSEQCGNQRPSVLAAWSSQNGNTQEFYFILGREQGK